MLTGTLKADWIQLPVERYLAVFPTLKQGVIAGVFKIKGASPWAITRAEKLQVSVFLPNEHSMDDWYSGVYALLTVWPDVSIMGINNMRKVVGYDFHHMRRKYDVPGMWGNVRPIWRLLHPIDLGMIWRTKLGLMTIGMPGTIGKPWKPDYGGYVNQLLPWSFLVSMEPHSCNYALDFVLHAEDEVRAGDV